MTGRLDGKRCLITGAGSGMGRAAAETFAREGGAVAVCDIDGDRVREVVDGIRASGGVAHGQVVDVTEEASVESAVAEVVTALGGLDVCWANAGAGGEGSVESTSKALWDSVIALNLSGAFLTAKYVMPHLVAAGGGSLIFTSSSGAVFGTPNVASNMAAKAGLLGLTKQIALDYLAARIRVNAICPGPIMTPALVDNLAIRDQQMGQEPGTTLAHFAERSPLGRFGQPQEVANVALFLASDESSWVNAQHIVVSGTGS